MTPERLAELTVADAEGRVAVLPCKIGGVAFAVHPDTGINEYTVSYVEVFGLSTDSLRFFGPPMGEYGPEWIHSHGNDEVYFTRAEAEEAMEKMKAEEVS